MKPINWISLLLWFVLSLAAGFAYSYWAVGNGYSAPASGISLSISLACVSAILLFLALPILLVALAVRYSSPGPALYWSDRVGRNNQIFKMPKFRSMRIDTPAVATHLLDNPSQWLSPIGSFLRKSRRKE